MSRLFRATTAAVVLSVVALTTACSGNTTRTTDTTASAQQTSSGTNTPPPSTPTGSQSSTSSGSPATTAPSPPPLSASAAADRVIGSDNVRTAYDTLAAWILDTGFQPELVRTSTPTEADLAPVTDLMTDACTASFLGDVRNVTDANTNSLESLVSIGVRAKDGTVISGDQAVTNRAVTSATADLDNQQRLVLAIESRADIHYRGDSDPTKMFHSTLVRTTSYVLVQQAGRWLLDAWQGTYKTTDPVAD